MTYFSGSAECEACLKSSPRKPVQENPVLHPLHSHLQSLHTFAAFFLLKFGDNIHDMPTLTLAAESHVPEITVDDMLKAWTNN
jgi:hypothetical protein